MVTRAQDRPWRPLGIPAKRWVSEAVWADRCVREPSPTHRERRHQSTACPVSGGRSIRERERDCGFGRSAAGQLPHVLPRGVRSRLIWKPLRARHYFVPGTGAENHFHRTGQVLTPHRNLDLPFFPSSFSNRRLFGKHDHRWIPARRGIPLRPPARKFDAGRDVSTAQVAVALFPARMHRVKRRFTRAHGSRMQQMVQRGDEVGMVACMGHHHQAFAVGFQFHLAAESAHLRARLFRVFP